MFLDHIITYPKLYQSLVHSLQQINCKENISVLMLLWLFNLLILHCHIIILFLRPSMDQILVELLDRLLLRVRWFEGLCIHSVLIGFAAALLNAPLVEVGTTSSEALVEKRLTVIIPHLR